MRENRGGLGPMVCRNVAGRAQTCGRRDAMRDVIQKVIEAEAEAKRLVQAARIEAERMESTARKQAQDLVAQARQEARWEAEKILEAATQEAEQERKERLAGATARIETQVRLDDPTLQRAAEAAARCVCGVTEPIQGE
ncbi:MAG: hypothetical protein KGJ60_12055 [Verrucomicrobiota bacterium]|nr:hypothetical protein [Verrucomicrobiota bacterium]